MLFYVSLLCLFLAGGFCIIAVYLVAEWILSWNAKPKSVKQSRRKKRLPTACWLLLMTLICSGCANNTCVPIEVPSCPPMLRAATYNAMQADERRDYRIAVESCKAIR